MRRFAATVAVLAMGLVAGLLSVMPAQASTPPSLDMWGRSLDTCLRHATQYPGGMLVYTDERIYTSHMPRLQRWTWNNGRPACVVRNTAFNVARALDHWKTLPQSRRPDTVIVAVPGTTSQVRLWYGNQPRKRLIGSHDSAFGSQIYWPGYISGESAGARIMTKLGEQAIYAGAWGGTQDYWLKRSSVSQCNKAAASPKGVLVLGDSITSRDWSGMNTALTNGGLVPCILSQGSGRVKDLVRRAKEQKVPIPPTVIFALGNNDIFSPPQIRQDIFAAQLWAGPETNIVWPTIWRTKPGPLLSRQQHNALMINTVIRDIHASRPNSYVMDWYKTLRNHPSWQYDGIHLTSLGLKTRYATMIASVELLLRA